MPVPNTLLACLKNGKFSISSTGKQVNGTTLTDDFIDGTTFAQWTGKGKFTIMIMIYPDSTMAIPDAVGQKLGVDITEPVTTLACGDFSGL
jgi:hypothetical protein